MNLSRKQNWTGGGGGGYREKGDWVKGQGNLENTKKGVGLRKMENAGNEDS